MDSTIGKITLGDLRLWCQFEENVNKYHRRYAVTYTFSDDFSESNVKQLKSDLNKLVYCNNVISEALNELWLNPQYHPNTSKLHMHGVVDIKDMNKWKHALSLFEFFGSFHLEPLRTWYGWYLYCTREDQETIDKHNSQSEDSVASLLKPIQSWNKDIYNNEEGGSPSGGLRGISPAPGQTQ